MRSSHFLNIPATVARNPAAPYAVLPVPYERTVSYGGGTAKGPTAILRASREIEDFDEEFFCPVNVDVQTLPPPVLRGLRDRQALAAIRASAEPVMRAGRFLLSFGGEHTVSVPLVEAAKKAFGKISILHVDAHLDLWNKYRGTSLSHACVMRRIREMGLSTVHVGIRNCSTEEISCVRREHIPIFWAKDICTTNSKSWVEQVIRKLGPTVYISVDIDGLDPSLVPGTGTPEPGGMSWYQLTYLIRRVMSRKRVIAADIVETAPVPGSQVSEFVAARLGLKILLYHKHRGR
jgi:agmatinase